LRGVVVVGNRSHTKRHADAEPLQPANHSLKVGRALHSIDLFQRWFRWCEAGLIDLRFIHAGAVKVADELLSATPRPVRTARDLVQNVFQLLLRVLSRLPSPAPSRLGSGDGIVRTPRSIGVFEEIRAGIRFTIKIAQLNARLCGLLSNQGGR